MTQSHLLLRHVPQQKYVPKEEAARTGLVTLAVMDHLYGNFIYFGTGDASPCQLATPLKGTHLSRRWWLKEQLQRRTIGEELPAYLCVTVEVYPAARKGFPEVFCGYH